VNILGRMIQGDVVQIGTSVGIMIEVNTPNLKEAARLGGALREILPSLLEARGFSSPDQIKFEKMEAEDFEEIIGKVLNCIISSK